MNIKIGFFIVCLAIVPFYSSNAQDDFCSIISEFSSDARNGFASNQKEDVTGRGARRAGLTPRPSRTRTFNCIANIPGGSICRIKNKAGKYSDEHSMMFGFDQPNISSAETLIAEMREEIQVCGIARPRFGKSRSGQLGYMENEIQGRNWHITILDDDENEEYLYVDFFAWESSRSSSRRPPRAIVYISYEKWKD